MSEQCKTCGAACITPLCGNCRLEKKRAAQAALNAACVELLEQFGEVCDEGMDFPLRGALEEIMAATRKVMEAQE